jgi:hypothetical protein
MDLIRETRMEEMANEMMKSEAVGMFWRGNSIRDIVGSLPASFIAVLMRN